MDNAPTSDHQYDSGAALNADVIDPIAVNIYANRYLPECLPSIFITKK